MLPLPRPVLTTNAIGRATPSRSRAASRGPGLDPGLRRLAPGFDRRGDHRIMPLVASSKRAERVRMDHSRPFYFGNAAVDQVRDSGWFVGQFVPAELGPRHQTDVELKWAMHPDGDRRLHGAEAN